MICKLTGIGKNALLQGNQGSRIVHVLKLPLGQLILEPCWILLCTLEIIEKILHNRFHDHFRQHRIKILFHQSSQRLGLLRDGIQMVEIHHIREMLQTIGHIRILLLNEPCNLIGISILLESHGSHNPVIEFEDFLQIHNRSITIFLAHLYHTIIYMRNLDILAADIPQIKKQIHDGNRQ